MVWYLNKNVAHARFTRPNLTFYNIYGERPDLSLYAMSVAAAPTTGTRVAPSVSTSVSHPKSVGQDARPNTGVLNTLFRQIQMPPQKLPTSRVPSIVARMQRDTKSSKAKKGKWYRGDNYVDKNHYSWKNLSLFSDYQAQMWTNDGAIKQTYKK